MAKQSTISKKEFKQAAELFLVSFLFLFIEIALIRWVSGYVKIVAYFTNMILISAFLGGSIGLLIKKRNYISWFPLIILFLIASVYTYTIAYNVAIESDVLSEQTQAPSKSSVHEGNFLSKLLFPQGEWIWNTSTFLIYLVPIFFFLNALVFIPIGQLLAQKMIPFKPLKAYTIDIAGSLSGVIALSLLSLFSIQPFWWFLIGFCLFFYFLKGKGQKIIGSIAFGAALIIVAILGLNTWWSPYYKIIKTPSDQYGEFALTVNDDNILTTFNFDRPERAGTHYYLPYFFANPKNILIVGAGTGNDVVVAQRSGVEQIDAVEIDPTIIEYGSHHPNKPYNVDIVNIIINDARNYIKTTDKKYDAVIYGLLDSHRVFSHQSSVRLDNFVYTKEAMEETKKILAPNGIVVLSFWVGKDFIEAKIFNLLKEAYGEEPLVIKRGNVKTFIAGNDLKEVKLPEAFSYSQIAPMEVITPTDDYPFLYLKNRLKDTSYIRILLVVLVITALMLWFLTPGFRSISWHFFFLGAGFLLIETKSITEMALMFGSTWIINSFVIGGILFMILLANCYAGRYKVSMKIAYMLLLLSIALNFIVKPSSFLQDSFFIKVIAILIVSLPVFFAGIIFATSFKNVKVLPLAFGSNILGAVLGGAMEYSSLVFGIKSLYIIALAAYILSMLTFKK